MVRTLLPNQGAWVPSLVRELRFCMLDMEPPKIKKTKSLRTIDLVFESTFFGVSQSWLQISAPLLNS